MYLGTEGRDGGSAAGAQSGGHRAFCGGMPADAHSSSGMSLGVGTGQTKPLNEPAATSQTSRPQQPTTVRKATEAERDVRPRDLDQRLSNQRNDLGKSTHTLFTTGDAAPPPITD